MAHLTPYLAFNGNCRDAMEFYKTVFGGELMMQTFGEAPVNASEADKGRIMHAQLSSGNFMLMASDGMPDHPVTFGNSVTISVHPQSKEETEKQFNALSEGGQVTMPLSDTFWGAYFGMLTDKFGIPWMFNFQKEQPKNS
ncbi:VOC family protein [Adhaeribacter terreus]|uniref:VOC family protein n=1 Tax=Adhaeribacter terreus TaxID=529703 RepID=A0ABW0EFK9_9BACT